MAVTYEIRKKRILMPTPLELSKDIEGVNNAKAQSQEYQEEEREDMRTDLYTPVS